jgi:hypothetical protein
MPDTRLPRRAPKGLTMQATKRILTSSGVPYCGLHAVRARKPAMREPIEHYAAKPDAPSELTGRKRVCRKCRELKHVYGGRVLAHQGICYDCPFPPVPLEKPDRAIIDRRIALLTAALTRLKRLK